MPTKLAPRSLALTALLLAAGCASISPAQYRAMTAGVIGCPAEEIQLSDARTTVYLRDGITWRAECRGHRFICSQSGTAACKEELAPAAAPTTGVPAASPAPRP